MPRGKKGAYALAENGDGGLAPVRVTGDSLGVPGISRLQASEDRTELAGLAFLELLARSDGWLRCIPWSENKIGYFKWKFSSGPHKGKYVMYVANAGDWTGGILGLTEKLAEVDDGTRKPAMDTFYDPR